MLWTDGRYSAQVTTEAREFQIDIVSGSAGVLDMIGGEILKGGIQKILFDGRVTSYNSVEELQQWFSHRQKTPPHPRRGKETVHIISRKGMLQELRLVKEKNELDILAEAARITGRVFTRLVSGIIAGMTEQEIAYRIEMLVREEGAEGMSFPAIVASGKNGAFPHAHPTGKKIRKGELVTVDFGVRYRGYVSDMTRTVAIGRISPQLRTMYMAVQNAQELGCKKAKAGMTGAEIDAVCRNYLTKRGFGKYFTHSTGHGIGMEVHELPNISPHHTTSLPVRSVITCEPGIYIHGVGGVRIEDALILTKSGTINLTGFVSKELIAL